MHRILIAAVLFALMVGCSGSSTEGEVSGSITVDGKPPENGAVSFFPTDGKGPTVGALIVDGKYQVRGVPVGTAKVEIRVSRKIGEKKLYNTKESPIQPVLEEVLPAKYNNKSELTYEVVAGKQEKNWDLKTK